MYCLKSSKERLFREVLEGKDMKKRKINMPNRKP